MLFSPEKETLINRVHMHGPSGNVVGYILVKENHVETSYDTAMMMTEEDYIKLIKDASNEIEHLRAENEKLRDALIAAAAELEYAYIMSFKDQYRDAARAARKAVDSLQENKDEN